MFLRIQLVDHKIQYKTPRHFDLSIETKFVDMKSNQLIAVTRSAIRKDWDYKIQARRIHLFLLLNQEQNFF